MIEQISSQYEVTFNIKKKDNKNPKTKLEKLTKVRNKKKHSNLSVTILTFQISSSMF
jgi:hypothetical protein